MGMSNLGAVVLVLVLSLQVLYCSAATNACYAPPFVYGRECRSSTSIFGSPGYRIRYSVSVNGNAGTLVCCQGYHPQSRSFRGIGCGYGSFGANMDWGNYLDTPKIKCKGTPFGATLSWSP